MRYRFVPSALIAGIAVVGAVAEARPRGRDILYYSHMSPSREALQQLRTCFMTKDLIHKGHSPSYRPSKGEELKLERECEAEAQFSPYYRAIVMLDLLEEGKLESSGYTESFADNWPPRMIGASSAPGHAGNDKQGFKAWEAWWEANKDRDMFLPDSDVRKNIGLVLREFFYGTPETKLAAAKDLDLLGSDALSPMIDLVSSMGNNLSAHLTRITGYKPAYVGSIPWAAWRREHPEQM